MADGKGLKGNDDVILTVKEGALLNQFVNAWWLTQLQYAYSPYCFKCIFKGADREDLFNN